MGNKVTVQLASDTSSLDSGLTRAGQKINSFAANSNRALQSIGPSGGGNALRGVGNASLQVQDIAVQLQAGTSVLTTMSQQVPQLLGSIGPKGAIIGGLIAIGGALLTVGVKSKQAFDALMTDADAARDSVNKLGSAAGFSEINAALEKINASRKALEAGREKDSGFFGSLGVSLGVIVGGKNRDERRSDIANAEARANFDQTRLQKQMTEASRQSLEIARLKADGRNGEAAVMERQVKLAKELADIEASAFDAATKKQLAADARAKADLDKRSIYADAGKEPERKRQQEMDATRRILGLQKEIAEARNKDLEGADKLKALEAAQKQRQNDATFGGIGPLNEANIGSVVGQRMKAGDFAGAERALKALAEFERGQREIDALTAKMKEQAVEAAKKTAEDAKQTAEKEKQRSERQAELSHAQKLFGVESGLQSALLENGGKENEKTRALREQLAILEMTRTLQQQLGISAADASAMAENRVKLEGRVTKAVEDRKKAEERKDIENQARITALRARGQDAEADRAERALKVEEKNKKLLTAGYDPETARRAAEAMQRDEDALAKRREREVTERGRGRIKGANEAKRAEALAKWRGQAMNATAPQAATPAVERGAREAVERERRGDGDKLLSEIHKVLNKIEGNLHFVN